jgi:hypothetical protein
VINIVESVVPCVMAALAPSRAYASCCGNKVISWLLPEPVWIFTSV